MGILTYFDQENWEFDYIRLFWTRETDQNGHDTQQPSLIHFIFFPREHVPLQVQSMAMSEKPDVTYADIGGMDIQKQEINAKRGRALERCRFLRCDKMHRFSAV